MKKSTKYLLFLLGAAVAVSAGSLLLRRSSSNLNQLARRVNATGRIYEADIADLTRRQEELLEGVRAVLLQLANIS